MRIRDLLEVKKGSVITVSPGDELSTAIDLLVRHNIGALPVLERSGTVVGLVGEREIVRAVREHPHSIERLLVRDIMQVPPLCDVDDSVEDAMRRMTSLRQRHLVVRDHGRVAGVISVGDIVKQRLDQLETETNVLRDYVAAQRATH